MSAFLKEYFGDQFKSFLNFEESFELFNRDGDSLLIEVNAPKWVEWTWSDEMYFKLCGLPPEGSLGSHDVTVSATDSAGLSTVANLNLKVKFPGRTKTL